jgi:predicted nucleic acid-binding protein
MLGMALNPRKFHLMTVTDTCSVWNLLSSQRLFRSACSAKIYFCITPMVLYECLHKPRKFVTPEATELISLFPVQESDLNDLLQISRSAPLKLSSGELSCIAIAYQITTMAFMSDDRRACKYAEDVLRLIVETTPKLYAWLHYYRHLTDGDHSEVIAEHERFERRPLTPFFNEAYEAALQHRLMSAAAGLTASTSS